MGSNGPTLAIAVKSDIYYTMKQVWWKKDTFFVLRAIPVVIEFVIRTICANLTISLSINWLTWGSHYH